MSDRYKFRGKRVDNGEWVYGFLAGYVNDGNVACIATEETCPDMGFHVHPDTVGQYTGLKDKNGTEIYGGDRVKSLTQFFVPHEGVVCYKDNAQAFLIDLGDGHSVFTSAWAQIEVIGTIHDKEQS